MQHRQKKEDISFLVDKCIGKGVTLYVRICKNWKEIVGEKISKNSLPSFISRGKLYVNVSSSPWKSELEFLKNDLLSKINNRIRPYFIREIHFKIGPIVLDDTNSLTKKIPKNISKKNIESIHEASENIHDKDLQDIFKHAMLRSYSRKE